MRLSKSMDIVTLYGMLDIGKMIETKRISDDDLEVLLLIVKLKYQIADRSKKSA